jgi:hypothetical protein
LQGTRDKKGRRDARAPDQAPPEVDPFAQAALEDAPSPIAEVERDPFACAEGLLDAPTSIPRRQRQRSDHEPTRSAAAKPAHGGDTQGRGGHVTAGRMDTDRDLRREQAAGKHVDRRGPSPACDHAAGRPETHEAARATPDPGEAHGSRDRDEAEKPAATPRWKASHDHSGVAVRTTARDDQPASQNEGARGDGLPARVDEGAAEDDHPAGLNESGQRERWLGQGDEGLGLTAGRGALPVVRRRRRRIGKREMALGAGGLLVVTLAVVAVLPVYLLERAAAESTACFEAIERSGNGEARACVPSLWLPESLPWFSGDAAQLQIDLAYRAAVLDFARATAIAPDAAERDAAARRIYALGFGISRPTNVDALAAVPGAFETQVALALESDDKRIRELGYGAARALADIEAIRALAAHADPGDAPSTSLERGAALCLLGDEAAGQRALVAADEAARSAGETLGMARLALLACRYDGRLVDPRTVEPALFATLARFEAALGQVEGIDRARGFLEEPSGLTPVARLRLGAIVADATRSDAIATLGWLAPARGTSASPPLESLESPWLLLDPADPVDALITDPGASGRVAAALLAAELGDQPLGCRGAECPSESVLARPGASARQLAWMLWLDAAAEHARRGATEPAKQALAHADALAEDDRRRLSGAIHLVIDDAAGALAVVEAPGERPALERLAVERTRALALAHLGRFDEALRAAEAAYAAAARAEDDVTAHELAALGSERGAAAWLWAALATRAERGREVRAVLDQAGREELTPIVEWLELAISAENDRRPLRLGASLGEVPTSTLPAVVDLVARALPEGAEVEIFLDRIFDPIHRRAPLRTMLARAEAARWRGDAEAAERWLERAARLRALPRDERGALLAHLARLH